MLNIILPGERGNNEHTKVTAVESPLSSGIECVEALGPPGRLRRDLIVVGILKGILRPRSSDDT